MNTDARIVVRIGKEGQPVSGWQVLAWVAIVALTVLRVALIVGVVALVVAIVRGVRAAMLAKAS